MFRRLPLIAFVLVAVAVASPIVAHAAEPLPNSMAALGDSITRAYNTGSAYTDNPAGSWSTGTTASVNSHYTRVSAQNPAIAGKNFNDAVSGAKIADLAGQVSVANGQKVDYVTILMGGNDVCTSSEATMTSVADFNARFKTAMTALAQGSPNAKVYVLSVPDVYNLWAILKNNGSARFTWAIFGICQSLLARPTSTAQADVDRRARVQQRNKDFNLQLATVCAAYATYLAAGGSGQCRYDGGAAFNTKFVPADVSTRDYFHPSLAGQAKLASVSWSAGYWGP
ncbi:MAG: GDSL-type esterase/lipase family protein [Chloroflexota bacterium]|nr:GDSL-type esterase/lipase family protein [Chloroflexota bacterium]